MNISLQNTDKVSATLTVKLDKSDYQEKVDKALKKLRQNVNMPGFRPGMVPMGLVKKQFGRGVMAEEINKLLQEKVFEYIRENNLKVLGEPLPDEEKQQPVDFDHQEEYEFVFDLALAPEFKTELSKDDVVPYYDINVSDEMVGRQVSSYRQRGGKYEKVEDYQDKDMLKGHIAELDADGNVKDGGLQVEDVVMMPSYFKDEEQKSLFAGAKVGAVVKFNPYKAYDGSAVELSSFLKIAKESIEEHKGEFSFQINEITRFVEAELTQELFDQVFGKDVVKTEEEFKSKIRETIQTQLVGDSDYKFLVDVRNLLVSKIGKLEFNDALLKKIMLLNNRDKGEEFVTENYDKSIEELTWHLIKEQLVKENAIKVEQNDIVEQAKKTTIAQFAQYGMINLPDEMLNNYANEMLKKQETVQAMVDRAIESKLAVALKDKVTLDHKGIEMEEFTKMFE